MTVQCLTDSLKDHICAFYKARTYPIKEIARTFNTSPRTINRVLIERGYVTSVARLKGDAYLVMRFLATKDITTVDALEKAFSPRAINPDDVQGYLNNCTSNELTTHYYRAVHAHTVRNIPNANPVHVPRKQTGDLFAPA